MKESKLISYLSSFSKEEMKRFEKFVNSPYFNSERNFKPLLKFLKENHPHFDNSLITIEFIFHKLHPCIPYDKRSSLTTRVMISQLTSLAEKFIAIEGCQKNEGFMSSSLLRELLQKGQAKQFKILRRKLDIEVTKSELDYDNLVKKLLVEREINCWTNCGNNKEEVQRIERLLKFEDTIITIFVAMISDLIQWLSKDYYKNGERSELSKKFFENFNFDKFIDSLSDLKNENSSMLQYVYYSIRMEKDTNDFQAYEKYAAPQN